MSNLVVVGFPKSQEAEEVRRELVTIQQEHLIALEDESSSKQLERAFRKRGINFELGVKFKSAELKKKEVKVTLEDGKEFAVRRSTSS